MINSNVQIFENPDVQNLVCVFSSKFTVKYVIKIIKRMMILI